MPSTTTTAALTAACRYGAPPMTELTAGLNATSACPRRALLLLLASMEWLTMWVTLFRPQCRSITDCAGHQLCNDAIWRVGGASYRRWEPAQDPGNEGRLF